MIVRVEVKKWKINKYWPRYQTALYLECGTLCTREQAQLVAWPQLASVFSFFHFCELGGRSPLFYKGA